MYSRNTWEKKQEHGYTLPPGYDGNRFQRRRRTERNDAEDEVILIPDSGFSSENDASELSVGGIPTQKGRLSNRTSAANAENIGDNIHDVPYTDPYDTEDSEDDKNEQIANHSEKLSGIISKLGFVNGLSSDDLLLCAIIFIIASDKENGGKNAGDILLILALLLGIH